MRSPIMFLEHQIQDHIIDYSAKLFGLCQKGSVAVINTIVFRNKQLFRTMSSDIYQNENRADYLHFLINKGDLLEFDLENTECALCIALPHEATGKIMFLNFDGSKYGERYLCSFVPITKALTKNAGKFDMWLIFSYTDKNALFHYLPTNRITFNVIESTCGDSFIDPDETSNPLSELTGKVQALENSKISIADVVEDSIVFYSDSNKQNIVGTVPLPNNVIWTVMED